MTYEPVISITTPWGTFTTKDRIISFGNIATYTTDLGSSSSVSLTLDDTDGAMFDVYNGGNMYNDPVSVYQTFVGGPSPVLLFTGLVGGDIIWDEGQRTLSFDVESVYTAGKVGHIPETTTDSDGNWSPTSWPWPIATEVASLDKQSFNKMWPLAFGTVVNSPALRLTKPNKGSTIAPLTEDSTTITVEHGDKFPQSPIAPIIRVGSVLYQGTFTGDVFTPTVKNKEAVLLAPLFESKFATRVVGDPDETFTNVAWVKDMYNYLGMWLKVTGPGITGSMIIKVSKQLGRKLWFDVQPSVLLKATHVITGFSGALKTGWMTGNYAVVHESPISEKKYIAEDWAIGSGAPVIDETNAVQWYVVNTLPSSTIKSVKAYRSVKGVRTLETIPEAYYTYYPTQVLDGISVSALAFPVALDWIPDEEWETDVYVTFESTKGPNAADVIKYILDTYTSFSTDGTFATVASAIADYPVGFTLTKQADALKLCASIAWQARCAMYQSGTTISIMYLSAVPGTPTAITNSLMVERTLRLGFTRIDDVKTSLKAIWNEDYSEGGERTLTYSNNTSLYGKIEEDYDFFIYNQAALVKKSLDFWGYRMSNIWRTVQFEVPLIGSIYVQNRAYNITIPYFGGAYATLQSASQGAGITQALAFVMAVKIGFTSMDINYWTGSPSNPISSSDPDLAKDPSIGYKEKDYYPLVGVPEPVKIYTVSTKNTSGREVKQFDIMMAIKKDDTTADVTDTDGTAIKYVDVDGAHRLVTELVIVDSVTASGDPAQVSAANKPNSRVKWNGSVTPKVGQIWGPLMWDEADVAKRATNYVPGTIDPRGNAFVILGAIDANAKTVLVAPSSVPATEEIEFHQSDSPSIPDGDWPAYVITGCDKRLVGVYAICASGTCEVSINVNGVVPTAVFGLTITSTATVVTLPGEGAALPKFGKVYPSTVSVGTATGVEIKLKFVNYGSAYTNIGDPYAAIV